MRRLEEMRAEIDRIDREMAKLFEERMALAGEVADYKKENGLPVFDPVREAEILARAGERVSDPALAQSYRTFQGQVMRISRNHQHKKLDDLYTVTDEGGYPITIGRGAIRRVGELCDLRRRVLIVSDSGVPASYREAVAAQCKHAVLAVVPQGETSKAPAVLEKLHAVMLEQGFTRRDCVVAVGGGVVGDLAGFAAATYMRGVDFINLPTTLLAQVDSSVGGKTAINLRGVKNPVGVFKQPTHVIVDPDVLATLDPRDFRAGLAEAIKMAATHDPDLFALIEENDPHEMIAAIIRRSIEIKMQVVEADEKEGDLRRVLNFGHTVGHAVEALSEGSLRHGECVAIGTLYFAGGAAKERLTALYHKVGLPTKTVYDPDQLIAAIRHDKKAAGNAVTCVQVDEIGQFTLQELTWEELSARIRGEGV